MVFTVYSLSGFRAWKFKFRVLNRNPKLTMQEQEQQEALIHILYTLGPKP